MFLYTKQYKNKKINQSIISFNKQNKLHFSNKYNNLKDKLNNLTNSLYNTYITKILSYYSSKKHLFLENTNKSLSSHTNKSFIVKIINSSLQILSDKVKGLSKIKLFELSTIKSYLNSLVKVINQSSLTVKDYYLICKNKSLTYLESHRNKELNSLFKNYMTNITKQIESSSSKYKPLSYYISNNKHIKKLKSSKFFTSIDIITVLNTNINKINGIINAEGKYGKKFHFYKLKYEKTFKEKLKKLSNYEKILLFIKYLVGIYVIAYILKLLYMNVLNKDKYEGRRIEDAFKQINEMKQMNKELVQTNESLRLLLEKEFEIRKKERDFR